MYVYNVLLNVVLAKLLLQIVQVVILQDHFIIINVYLIAQAVIIAIKIMFVNNVIVYVYNVPEGQ